MKSSMVLIKNLLLSTSQWNIYSFCRDGKKKGRIIGMYLVSALMNNPSLQKKMKISMTEGMMMQYRKAIEKAKRSKGRRYE